MEIETVKDLATEVGSLFRTVRGLEIQLVQQAAMESGFQSAVVRQSVMALAMVKCQAEEILSQAELLSGVEHLVIDPEAGYEPGQ